MKVFSIFRNKLLEIKKPYFFEDGSVFIVETNEIIWIWVGSKSYAEKTSLKSWVKAILVTEVKKKDIKIIFEGKEPKDFKKILDYKIKKKTSPAFLKDIDSKTIEDYTLLKILKNKKGVLTTMNLDVDYKEFKSEDTLILDLEDEIFIWYGKKSHKEEKEEALKMARKIINERKKPILIYNIEETKEPLRFSSMVYQMGIRDGIIEFRKMFKEKHEKEEAKEEKKWWEFWKK
jgi:hypothetical protein